MKTHWTKRMTDIPISAKFNLKMGSITISFHVKIEEIAKYTYGENILFLQLQRIKNNTAELSKLSRNG